MRDQLRVDIVSDVVCPWCLVGLQRLDNALARLDTAIAVELVHHPFLLDADAPTEGEDVVAMLRRKYGHDPFDMWDRIEREAAASGLALDMRKQKLRYASQRSMALISAAAEKGTQHDLERAIAHAYYLSARNIADLDVLAEIAAAHGFEPGEARAIASDPVRIGAVEEGARAMVAQGISGVPFFLFDRRLVLSGCQAEEIFDRALAAALDDEPATAAGR